MQQAGEGLKAESCRSEEDARSGGAHRRIVKDLLAVRDGLP
jgi:hypothetical protein